MLAGRRGVAPWIGGQRINRIGNRAQVNLSKGIRFPQLRHSSSQKSQTVMKDAMQFSRQKSGVPYPDHPWRTHFAPRFCARDQLHWTNVDVGDGHKSHTKRLSCPTTITLPSHYNDLSTYCGLHSSTRNTFSNASSTATWTCFFQASAALSFKKLPLPTPYILTPTGIQVFCTHYKMNKTSRSDTSSTRTTAGLKHDRLKKSRKYSGKTEESRESYIWI